MSRLPDHMLQAPPGSQFDRLFVLSVCSFNREKRNVLCVCGTEKSVWAHVLHRGTVRSCGCLWKERVTKHGRVNSSEYHIWEAVKQRCLNPKDARYRDYGGRGITICESWLLFVNFFNDVGTRPSSAHSLDRINNDLGYEKNNVRWSTRSEQQNNRRGNRLVEAFGRTQTLTQWACETGIKFDTLRRRLEYEWPVEIALTKTVGTGLYHAVPRVHRWANRNRGAL